MTATVDGEQRHFSVSVSTVGNEPHRGRVIVFHDVTAQKRRQRELQRQNERLDQFASVVTHDLRNPLTVIQGHAELARQTGEERHLEKVDRATDRMETIIDDTLTLARAGQTVEETEPVGVADVARTAWEHVRTDDAALDLRVPDGTTVGADRDRLLHVFENLFRNALEHNDPPVTVRVGTLDASDGPTSGGEPAADGLFVEDDGTGIPPGEREEVFEHGYTTGEDGTGFGLAIVRDVVEAHGWRVSVTDGIDGGARFEITGVDDVE